MVTVQKKIAGLSEASLERFVLRARKAAGLKVGVNVLVTGGAAVQLLNRRFLGKNKTTDVLSFPSPFPAPARGAGVAGDIAISADAAIDSARILGHTPVQEIKILTLHGILHLAGFDHERDNGAMARQESKLRRSLKLPVGLIERAETKTGQAFAQGGTSEIPMSLGVIFALLLLLGLLTLVSYVDLVYQEIGKFLSREFQDNIDVFESKIEPNLRVSRNRAALSMAILKQLTTASISLLVGYVVFADGHWGIYEILQATISLILVIVVCNRFIPFLFFSRGSGHWMIRWTPVLRIFIYLVLPVTIVLGFLQSVASLTTQNTGEQPESPAEAVDALIEAGQEEGIIQEGDRDLIQSVVEFSGKTVREAMKPRPEMFAVPVETTVEHFIEMLRAKHYSRVPVYEENIHNIKGIIYAQDVLQVPDSEAHTRTLATLMRRDVYFVPESKLGSDLLREMQRKNIRMAVVVDEYGGVAGLVTIEDLVEEIVGEIRDEHEKPEIVRESDRTYIVSGSTDVDRLAELFGVKPEGKESATVAGLVSELAGRIPRRGEVVEEDGLRFEVLESTDRLVERVRITVSQPQQQQLKLI